MIDSQKLIDILKEGIVEITFKSLKVIKLTKENIQHMRVLCQV